MSTTIKYKNLYGEDMTLQQLPNVNDYNKVQLENGTTKRIDTFYDKELNSGIYYLSPNEDMQSILLEFSKIWLSTEIFLNTQLMGAFISKEWEIYKGITLVSKGRTIYDDQEREIAAEFLSLNTFQVEFVEKRFYLTSLGEFIDVNGLPGFGRFDFYYTIGSIEVNAEVNLPGFEIDIYKITDTQNIFNHSMIRPLFKWEDHPYYHSALPLVPNSPTV